MVLNQAVWRLGPASNIHPVPEDLHQVERYTIPVKERSQFQVIIEKEKTIFSVIIYSFSNGIRVIVYGMTDLSCI
jgi:hypothetical protein